MAFFQSKHLWIRQLPDGVAMLTLDRDQGPVNYFDLEMLSDLEQGLDTVAKTAALRLLVIRTGKPANFCHGASPALLATWTKDDFRTWCERGQKLCSKLADLPIPSVCIVAGSCHDAGLELALACDHRVVANRPATSLGFPSLEWGMIPCWGATQRLPRLIGLDNSLRMLLGGQRLDAYGAWVSSLADDLTDDDSDAPPGFLADPTKHDWTKFPRRNWRERWLESNRLGRWFLFRGADRIVQTRVPEDMPAQAEILGLVRRVHEVPNIQAGLDLERQAVDRIVEHPALHHFIRLLLHRDKLRLPPVSSDQSRIKHIGIIGGGPASIALMLHAVLKGCEVVLRTQDEASLGAGIAQIAQLLSLEAKRGSLSDAQLRKAIAAVRGTIKWNHFEKLHLVVDNTEGSLEEKQRLIKEIEKHVPDTAIVSPATLRHRVDDLRQVLRRPERVVGLHFIEPWNRSSLVEIVAPGPNSTLHARRLREWLVGLGRCCLDVPDRIGGLAMRIWLPALNEAGVLLRERVGVERVDHAMRRFGMTHGPFEWMDRLGIDGIAGLLMALQPQFADRIAFQSRFAVMVEKQWLGAKTEYGFYQPGFRNSQKPNWDAVRLWETPGPGETTRISPALAPIDFEHWIQNRLVTLTILESLRCLDEGLVTNADDLDCALCLTGWATHRGGPIGYARSIGADELTARCTELARDYGERYALAPSLLNILGAPSGRET